MVFIKLFIKLWGKISWFILDIFNLTHVNLILCILLFQIGLGTCSNYISQICNYPWRSFSKSSHQKSYLEFLMRWNALSHPHLFIHLFIYFHTYFHTILWTTIWGVFFKALLLNNSILPLTLQLFFDKET